MATRSVALTFPDTHMGPGRSLLGSYTGLLNGDDGAPCAMLGYDEVSIVVTGTFGAGGSATLEGSHDGVTYFALRNHAGTAIAITAAGGDVAAASAFRFVRPRVTAGDGTTSLGATLFLRSVSRG